MHTQEGDYKPLDFCHLLFKERPEIGRFYLHRPATHPVAFSESEALQLFIR